MLIISLLTVLLVFLIYLYNRWINLKQYWSKRNVSHIPPHPLIGNMTFLQRHHVAEWMRSFYDNFKEPYVGIWIFWRPSLIINSPDIARNILIRDHAVFKNRLASSGTTDPVGNLNLFMLNDPVWSIIRKRLTPLFTASKLKYVQCLLRDKSMELVQRIDKERGKSQPIDIRNLMTDFSTDLTGGSSFGVVSDATLSGDSGLRTITRDFMKYNLFRAISWCSAFFIPELTDFFRFKVFPTESIEYMRKILREIIAQRGGLDNKVTDSRDLLDILIKIKQENGKELEMTENMMLAQAVVFLQGGFETTSQTLTFAIYELAYCPEAQEQLNAELQQARDKFGEDVLEGNVLSQLTYLNCVIYETLRKYPGFSWMDRVASKDYKVDDNLTIEAGTPVLVNVLGMHYDSNFYTEPNRFNPDRFLPENEIDIKFSPYLPFGDGPRKCIGQRLGLSNVRHGLAAIMLNYELKPLPNLPKPSEIKLDKNTMFFASAQMLSVEFVPKN